MQRRQFLTGLGIVLGLTATSRVAWAGEAPKEIIEELYQLSAAKKGEWQSMFLQPAVRNRTFSKALLRAWAAADAGNRPGEPGWLDFDIMSSSQDPSVNGLRVTVASEAATKITVRAIFRVEPNLKSRMDQVLYDFILEGEEWRLDEVRGNPGADQWSLRKLTREAAAFKR